MTVAPPSVALDGHLPRKTGTQSIERAIAVLRLFSTADVTMSLSQVVRRVGLTTATTHRILATLVHERLLSNDGAERYQIGPDALFLFAAAASRYGFGAARSELELVAAATRETAAVGVLDGTDAVVVMQVESDRPLRFTRPIGTRVPAHASAMGKAILAASGRDLATIVDELGHLHRFTDHTITDRPRLVAQLELARSRGWAVNDNERYCGVRAVAVPITRPEGAHASLGIQAPADRLTDAQIADAVQHLTDSARRLSTHLQLPSL